MTAWRVVAALALVPPGVAAGVFANLLVDRVPLRRPLRPLGAWPRQCPAVELAPLPLHPDDVVEEAPPDEADTVLAPGAAAGTEGPASDEAPELVGLPGRSVPDADLMPDPELDPHPGPTRHLVPYEEGPGHGAPFDLRPFRRPRCPECGIRSSVRYPVVELLLGALFAATVLHFGADWVVPAYLVLFTCLVAVSVVDLGYHIIPNRIVYPTIALSVPLLALAALASGDGQALREAFTGAAAAWFALLVIHLVSPRGMGFGDVRLAFILGLFLGWLSLPHVATGIFMGFVLGAAIGVGLIALGAKGRRDAIPFGPFLAAGTTLTIFVGGPIIRWWIG